MRDTPNGGPMEDSDPDILRGITAIRRYVATLVEPEPSYRAVFGWIASGALPAWNFGGMKHASKAQIRAALEGREVEPANTTPDPEPIPQHVNGAEPAKAEPLTTNPINETRLEKLKRIREEGYR